MTRAFQARLHAAHNLALSFGHDIARLIELDDGKWGSWCRTCNKMVVVYLNPPNHLPHTFGGAISVHCGKGKRGTL